MDDNRKIVLFVSVDPETESVMVAFLCRFGYRPRACRSFELAQSQLAVDRPGLVLCDWAASCMGPEFLVRSAYRLGIPTVVLTPCADFVRSWWTIEPRREERECRFAIVEKPATGVLLECLNRMSER